MPPRHGDSPLRHRALRIAFGDGGKNASRFFIEKRMEQGHAASEIGLDVRRARDRKGYFSNAAQVAWFGSGRGFNVSYGDKTTGQSDARDKSKRAPSNHV